MDAGGPDFTGCRAFARESAEAGRLLGARSLASRPWAFAWDARMGLNGILLFGDLSRRGRDADSGQIGQLPVGADRRALILQPEKTSPRR